MAYLTGYQHDVFVSYAHGPSYGAGTDPLSRWTRRLRADLAAEIMISLGTKDPSRRVDVWMDERLAGNVALTETLKSTVQQSAVFVAVMSPFYLQGNWCSDEVAWFASGQRDGAAVAEHIFVVRAIDTDSGAWPAVLKDSAGHPFKGYAFHAPPSDHEDQTRPYGWPTPQDSDEEYFAAVRRLAVEIARKIRRIENEKMPAVAATPRRSVYLGYMHDTLEDRDELRAALSSAGLTVLPNEEDEAVDEQSLREALTQGLPGCDAIVLMANEYGGLWPKDEPGGYLGLQIRRAAELRIPSFLWLRVADFNRIKRPAYRAYLEALTQPGNVEPACRGAYGSIKAFADAIVAGLAAEAPRDKEQDADAHAVICSNRPQDEEVGRTLVAAVKRLLREAGRENFAFDFANPKEERIKLANIEKRLRDADTVLVLCFDQDWDWARPLLRQLNLLNYLRQGSKARLLVAGPKDTGEGLYDAGTLGFETIDVVSGRLEDLEAGLKRELPRLDRAAGAAKPLVNGAAGLHNP